METNVNRFYELYSVTYDKQEKQQIATEFRAWFEALLPTDRVLAREAMQPLLDAIKNSFEALDNKARKRKNTKRSCLSYDI